MISPKAIITVIIVAILIGVAYVSIEKNFYSQTSINSKSSSLQELPKDNLPKQSSLITLPTPPPSLSPISESSDLLSEVKSLQMRDYSSYFEDLKIKLNND